MFGWRFALSCKYRSNRARPAHWWSIRRSTTDHRMRASAGDPLLDLAQRKLRCICSYICC
jgi:hypothetical protein